MTIALLKDIPEHDTQFVTVYMYQGKIWSMTCRVQDGWLEVYDTLKEDDYAIIASFDETLSPDAEILYHIVEVEE